MHEPSAVPARSSLPFILIVAEEAVANNAFRVQASTVLRNGTEQSSPNFSVGDVVRLELQAPKLARSRVCRLNYLVIRHSHGNFF
jgi:hypothetical protein